MALGRLPFLLVPLLAMAASAACSQSAAPAAPGGMTLERFLDRQTGRILAADTDGDGGVSRAEMDAMATKGGRDPARRFDAMDANHDGYLDKPEIQAALTKRFHRMDRNGDGTFTADERLAARTERGQGRRTAAPSASQP